MKDWIGKIFEVGRLSRSIYEIVRHQTNLFAGKMSPYTHIKLENINMDSNVNNQQNEISSDKLI